MAAVKAGPAAGLRQKQGWRWTCAITLFFRATSAALQFFTGSGDLQALCLDGKAELVGDLVFDAGDLFALEFDNPIAILANNMVVVRMLGVIGIVKLVVFAEIHLANQPAFGQKRQSAINRGA